MFNLILDRHREVLCMLPDLQRQSRLQQQAADGLVRPVSTIQLSRNQQQTSLRQQQVATWIYRIRSTVIVTLLQAFEYCLRKACDLLLSDCYCGQDNNMLVAYCREQFSAIISWFVNICYVIVRIILYVMLVVNSIIGDD